MGSDDLHCEFDAFVFRLEDGMHYHAIEVPIDAATRFEKKKIKRLLITLNGVESRRALQRKKDGRRIIMVGGDLLREAGLAEGEPAMVAIRPDPDPDYIELGEEFEEVLRQDHQARERWESFSLGRRRSFASHVNSGKKAETRLKRALELAEKIRTYTLYGDINE